MKNSEIEIGMIVKMNPDSSYIKNEEQDEENDGFFGNPVDCTGRVISAQEYVDSENEGIPDDGWIYVKWDNGQRNCYEKCRNDDLIVVE